MNFAERYLVNPDQSPRLASGKVWGIETVTVSLAGSAYTIDGLSALQAREIRERFGSLCRQGDSAIPPQLTLYRARPSAFLAVDFQGGEYTFDLEYEPDRVRFAGLDFMGEFDLGVKSTSRLLVPREETLVSHGIFENVFRTLVAYRLLQAGGVLLHSGAVAEPGAAYLFYGRSGAGKSTVSRLGLEAGFDVLSDDMNAVVPHGRGFVVEKLPFAGDLGQTSTPKGSYPVGGVYRLEQAAENRIVKMSPGSALASLLACAAFVNADPYRYDKLTSNLVNLVERVGVARLLFRKDGGFQDLLRGSVPL